MKHLHFTISAALLLSGCVEPIAGGNEASEDLDGGVLDISQDRDDLANLKEEEPDSDEDIAPTDEPDGGEVDGASDTRVATDEDALEEPGEPEGATIDFWVDSRSGDDSNDGSQQAPWRTLGHAVGFVSGDEARTVSVGAGDYSLSETTASGRTEYLTLKAAADTKPRVDGIYLNYENETNAFLRIEGFEVYTTTASTIVSLRRARFVQLVASEVHCEKWARGGRGVDGFKILDSSDILIERNHIHEVHRGLTATGNERVTIRRNYIRPKAGSGIQYAGGNADWVIEHNHLFGDSYVSHPTDPDAVPSPHASMISVRSGDLVLRGNHMHDMGSSAGVMFYTPDAAGGEEAYSDILIENNAIYNVINTYALRIYNLGSNVIIRNNLLQSGLREGGNGGDARYRYNVAVTVHSIAEGHDGSGLELYNNIFIGIVTVPVLSREYNNIVWSWSDWLSESPSGTSMIVTSRYHGAGNHSAFFESGFFSEDPDFFYTREEVTDWRLAPESVGVDFGDPGLQPEESLGSIGEDGFILDDGPRRSPTRHSAGPYQF